MAVGFGAGAMSHMLGKRIGNGAVRGCPFCRATFHMPPQVGERVFFLSGLSVGTWATVVPIDRPTEDVEFWVQRRGETTLRTICGRQDQVVPVEAFEIPKWLPPLCIEDSFYVHLSAWGLLSLPESEEGGIDLSGVMQAVNATVACCWSRRLPLTGMDIWHLVSAHGVPNIYKAPICQIFDAGMKLLVSTNGKVPNQRRRMSPLSQSRYLTKNKEALRERLFGRGNIPEIIEGANGHMFVVGG